MGSLIACWHPGSFADHALRRGQGSLRCQCWRWLRLLFPWSEHRTKHSHHEAGNVTQLRLGQALIE
eukprot:5827173-Amphidinium_carterae.1